LVERVEVVLPPEVAKTVDWFVELLGFESREKFVEAAVRRLVDHYLMVVP